MTRRSVVVAVTWMGTLSLAGYAIMERRSKPVPSNEDLLPRAGDIISIDSVNKTFAIDIDHGSVWLLVVTSSCPACLKLDTELTVLQEAARCAGTRLVPLIMEADIPPEAMKYVLERRGLREYGLGGIAGGKILGVDAVPSLIKIEREGRVASVASPALPGTWLNEETC